MQPPHCVQPGARQLNGSSLVGHVSCLLADLATTFPPGALTGQPINDVFVAIICLGGPLTAPCRLSVMWQSVLACA